MINHFLPFNCKDTTILPLLSSIRVNPVCIQDQELLLIQLLLGSSKTLRTYPSEDRNWGAVVWTKNLRPMVEPLAALYFLFTIHHQISFVMNRPCLHCVGICFCYCVTYFILTCIRICPVGFAVCRSGYLVVGL